VFITSLVEKKKKSSKHENKRDGFYRTPPENLKSSFGRYRKQYYYVIPSLKRHVCASVATDTLTRGAENVVRYEPVLTIVTEGLGFGNTVTGETRTDISVTKRLSSFLCKPVWTRFTIIISAADTRTRIRGRELFVEEVR